MQKFARVRSASLPKKPNNLGKTLHISFEIDLYIYNITILTDTKYAHKLLKIWITVLNSRPKSSPSLNMTIFITTTAKLQKMMNFFFLRKKMYVIHAFIFACYGTIKVATKGGVYAWNTQTPT